MASLGLDPRAWQACTGISKDKKKTTYFHNLITRKSFYALPPDEHHKICSDEELKCSVPPDNVNGLNAHFSKVIDRTRLEVDIVLEEELDVTAPTDIPGGTIDAEEEEEERFNNKKYTRLFYFNTLE
jgi:hypothetical protein